MSKTYTVTLSATQLSVIQEALDLYSRVGIGQIEKVAEVFEKSTAKIVFDHELKEKAIAEAKFALTGFPISASWGITNEKDVHDDFRVAYDLKQVFRHRLAWDRTPEGGSGNNFDKPMQWSKEDLAKVEKS